MSITCVKFHSNSLLNVEIACSTHLMRKHQRLTSQLTKPDRLTYTDRPANRPLPTVTKADVTNADLLTN